MREPAPLLTRHVWAGSPGCRFPWKEGAEKPLRVIADLFRFWRRMMEETVAVRQIRTRYRPHFRAARTGMERRVIKARQRADIATALDQIRRKFDSGSPYDLR